MFFLTGKGNFIQLFVYYSYVFWWMYNISYFSSEKKGLVRLMKLSWATLENSSILQDNFIQHKSLISWEWYLYLVIVLVIVKNCVFSYANKKEPAEEKTDDAQEKVCIKKSKLTYLLWFCHYVFFAEYL